MSSYIYARKVSIKKFLEAFASKRFKKEILRNLCEQNIQKEIFVQAKTLKKTFETCASKKNPLKLMQGRNF